MGLMLRWEDRRSRAALPVCGRERLGGRNRIKNGRHAGFSPPPRGIMAVRRGNFLEREAKTLQTFAFHLRYHDAANAVYEAIKNLFAS